MNMVIIFIFSSIYYSFYNKKRGCASFYHKSMILMIMIYGTQLMN